MPYSGTLSTITAPAVPINVHDSNTPRTMPEVPGWTTKVSNIGTAIAALTGPVDLLFCGDSITEFFQTADGADVWEQFYGNRNPFNMGIGGDETPGLLYRLTTSGHLRRIRPRLVVLEIGTNNTDAGREPFATPYQILDGILANLQAIRTQLPAAKVIVMSMLPRGTVGSVTRSLIDAANALLAVHPIIDGTIVRLVDISDSFKDEDGDIIESMYIDNIHPSEAGYLVWANAIEPYVVEAMATPTQRLFEDVFTISTTTAAAGTPIWVPLPNLAAALEKPMSITMWTTGSVAQVGNPATFAEASDAAVSYGWATSPSTRVAYGVAIDGGATTTATRRFRNVSSVLIYGDTAGVVQATLDVTDMSTFGGIWLMIDDDFPVDLVVHGRVLGGTSIASATINAFNKGTGGVGTQNVNAGNESRYVELLGMNSVSGTNSATIAFVSIGRCWVPTLTNQVVSFFSDHNAPATNSGCYGFVGEIHCLPNPTGGVSCQERYAISAGLGTGFTLSRLESGGTAQQLHVLSIAGTFAGAMGSIATGMDGASPIVVSPRITARSWGVWSVCAAAQSTQDITTNETALSIGSVETVSSATAVASLIDPDTADPTTTAVGYSRSGVYQDLSAAAAVEALMALSDENEFTMTTPAPAARFVMWAALGDAGGGAIRDIISMGWTIPYLR